ASTGFGGGNNTIGTTIIVPGLTNSPTPALPTNSGESPSSEPLPLNLNGIQVAVPPDGLNANFLQALFDKNKLAPGYNLQPKKLQLFETPGSDIPVPSDYPVGGADWRKLTAVDFNKLIVDPEGATGAVLGGFTLSSAAASGWAQIPPSIQALRQNSQSAFAKSCGKAVERLLPLRGAHYEGCVADTENRCHAALAAYVQNCVADPNTHWDGSTALDPQLPPMLPDKELAQIAQVSGILFQQPEQGRGGQIFCTATRISKDWLVTARHCVFRRTTADEEVSLGSETLRDIRHLQFFAFAEPMRAIQVNYKEDPHGTDRPWAFEADDLSSDYVFLKIKPDGPEPSFPELAAPRLWDRIVLFSYQYTERLSAGSAVTDDQLVSDGGWVKFMGYDASNTCVIAAMPRPNCLAYPCQSEVGSSGAPLFRFDNDRLQLVGVHAQHVVPGSHDPCTDPKVAALINVGVWLRSNDLDIATRTR
ncbi:trypsin-like peptidase domain-containing protein, partial [Mesorhizobium sp. M1E.F.Ca.ET.063.01.1.1]|uniref:trypsin-like serine peptidase n=1 Tax=Mesorhizobium sp. M1E.F.Ca.ET.063.01.1.1 TaxID=2496750 RepID=UPI000FD50ABB